MQTRDPPFKSRLAVHLSSLAMPARALGACPVLQGLAATPSLVLVGLSLAAKWRAPPGGGQVEHRLGARRGRAEKSVLGVPRGILSVQLGSVPGPTGPVFIKDPLSGGKDGCLCASCWGTTFLSSTPRALTRQPEAGRTAASFGLRPVLSELGWLAMLEQVETFEGIKLGLAESPFWLDALAARAQAGHWGV